MRRLAVVLSLAAALVAVALIVSRQSRPLNVVLVVFDTCRADHLGCYGHSRAATPAVDALAAEGVVFERAYAQVPLTLPSHTTLFTGTYPEQHRIRDNAAYVVPSRSKTLAEILQEHGYTTAAFVGAFPLDRRFGLDQGFDTYDGYFPLDSERKAEAVNAAVQEWLAGPSGDGPYFVFIHYFDPHLRYAPPEPYAGRFRDSPYEGEIAYADACLARLREMMSARCPPERTLWVFTSDHGEGLWEHEEQDHGVFLYDTTVRVPLIWSCPGRIARGQRVDGIAELADLVPTLLDLLEIEIPESVQGSSLLPALTDPPGSAGRGRSHAETYFGRLRHGWSGLRSLRTDRWLYIAAPREELYDLYADPHQLDNVLSQHPDVAASLSKRLSADVARFRAPPQDPRPVAHIDPETEARLLSLGYLGRVSKTIHDPGLEDRLVSGPDPKDRIASMRHLDRAREHRAALRWADAETELRAALAIDPGFTDSRQMLAEVLQSQDRPLDAATVWAGLAAEYPDDALYHMFHAKALEEGGQSREAAETYRRTVPLLPDPARGQAEYVLALSRMGMGEAFGRELRAFIQMGSLSAQTLNSLAARLLDTGAVSAARGLWEEGIRRFPEDPEAYNRLAWDLIDSGDDVQRGVDLAERAVNLDPGERSFLDTLGWGHLKLGETREAVAVLERAAEGPLVAEISHHLALAYLKAGAEDRAGPVLRTILEQAPDYARRNEIEELLGRP